MPSDLYSLFRAELLASRNADGYWTGRLSSSALATATAISALSVTLLNRRERTVSWPKEATERMGIALAKGTANLLGAQNADGGWGDTPRSRSNISTSMLAKSALILVGKLAADVRDDPNETSDANHGFAAEVFALNPDQKPDFPSVFAPALRAVDDYLRQEGGLDTLKTRYGSDRTFLVPILACAALAGLVSWRDVPAFPFELAALPRTWFRWLRLSVVSYAIPALVAVGNLRFHHAPPTNSVIRFFRAVAKKRTFRVIAAMQPASGGFLEATPLTAFVVMALAASGEVNAPMIDRGVAFLIDSMRDDGSWPIDTDLAIWCTTLAINGLDPVCDTELLADPRLLDIILAAQHRQKHPFTATAAGGWGWTNRSGGVPDADDTAGALLALAKLDALGGESVRKPIHEAAKAGIRWLLKLQNSDGGWPTFCRGWGRLPFDRSSCDITAHVVRAFAAWSHQTDSNGHPALNDSLRRTLARSATRGVRFLLRQQRPDGSWPALWFGNEKMPGGENPFYGTGRVLLGLAAWQTVFGKQRDGTVSWDAVLSPIMCCRTTQKTAWSVAPAMKNGVNFAIRNQNNDGGWGRGGGPDETEAVSSIEETGVVLESLATVVGIIGATETTESVKKGLQRLKKMVENRDNDGASPIGLYFAKLWYFESLYPTVFGLAAVAAVENSAGFGAKKSP